MRKHRRPIIDNVLIPAQWKITGMDAADADLALLFRAKSGLKNQIPGNKNPFLSNVLGPQYLKQADGSYQSNVLNMLTNSGFVGAVSGTPGTAPTGWGSFQIGGSFTSLIVDSLTFTVTGAGRYFVSQNIAVAANTVYRLTARVVNTTTEFIERFLHFASAPTGAVLTFSVDGEVPHIYGLTPVSPGDHIITVICTVGANNGTPAVRVGLGCTGPTGASSTVTISNPQLTEGATAKPYVKSPVSGPALGDVVDVIGGRKMLRTCGAVTNLLSGDTSIARSVTLTAQAYTLQVFGTGSVTCSYGTATVGNPLTFTATAGTVTFAPVGATLWMLTASTYPLPYTPPGTTSPASHATTTNGPWFSLPQYDDAPANTRTSRVWAALDGEPDGVELVTNGGFDGDLSGWMQGNLGYANWVWDNGTAKSVDAVAGDGNRDLLQKILTIGQPYILRITVQQHGGDVFVYSNPDLVLRARTVGTFSVTFVAKSPYINININAAGSVIDNISIKRIQPKPMTLAWRGVMGVGSGDLANGSTVNLVTPDDVSARCLTLTKDGIGVVAANLSDGVNTATVPITWARNANLIVVGQVLESGTQMRIGYYVIGTSSAITWGNAATYRGTFAPDGVVKKLMGSFGTTFPVWHDTQSLWDKAVADADIVKEMSK